MVEEPMIAEHEAADEVACASEDLHVGHERHLEDAAVPDRGRRTRERGASLVEYSLLLALIALVAMSAIMMLGGETEDGPRGINTSASSIMRATNP